MRSKIAKKLLATSVLTAMTIGLVGCGEEAGVENQPTQAPADDKKPTEAPATPSTDDKKEETPSTPDVQEPEEEVSPYTVLKDANGNVYDLGGMDIIIRDWWSGDPAEPSNAYEEELDAFRTWMQETYKFTLSQKAISDWGSTPADYLEYVTTGGDDQNYVFMQRPCTDLTNAMYQGLMYDLTKLDCLDFSESKWVAGVHNVYNYKGGIYGMAAEGAEPRLCVYFNKQVLKDAGIEPDSLYDIQENMQWTWDKFEEICAQVTRDLDSDGVNDVWGYVGQDSEIMNGFVYSNGGEYIGIEDGKFVYKLENQETLDGVRKTLELNEKYLRKNEPDGPWDYFVGAFAQGNVAFFIDQAYRGQGQLQSAQESNGTSFDWGVVCMPMGPNATDYTNVYDNNIAVIPAVYDAQRAWNVAFAYDMWYEPVPGFEDYAGWKAGYQKHYKDTESVDLTLARLKVNGRTTAHSLVPNVDMGPQFYWRFGEFNNDPAALAEAVRETWKAYIDEANK